MERTSEEKTLAGILHIAGIFSWIGLVLGIVLYFVYKPKSQFVANHSKQVVGFWVFKFAVSFVLTLVLGAGMAGAGFSMNPMALVGTGLLSAAVLGGFGIVTIVFHIIAAIKGFQGHEYRYPLIGNLTANIG